LSLVLVVLVVEEETEEMEEGAVASGMVII
jgi:hypothetical protein